MQTLVLREAQGAKCVKAAVTTNEGDEMVARRRRCPIERSHLALIYEEYLWDLLTFLSKQRAKSI